MLRWGEVFPLGLWDMWKMKQKELSKFYKSEEGQDKDTGVFDQKKYKKK